MKSTSTIFTTVPNPATLTQNGTVLTPTTVQSVGSPVSTVPPGPADPLVPEREPASIGEYAFLGCFGSATGFRTFTSRATSQDMTLQRCVELCTPDRYAGVRGRYVSPITPVARIAVGF